MKDGTGERCEVDTGVDRYVRSVQGQDRGKFQAEDCFSCVG